MSLSKDPRAVAQRAANLKSLQLRNAAPELLAACKAAEHTLSVLMGVGVTETLDKLRAAIAAAEEAP